jgi:single-strand DNA-binding protein
MEYKLKGKLIVKAEPRQFSEKFRVMDFVIETQDEKYPQKIQFQILNDRIQEMDKFLLGEELEISFDVRGREYAAPGKDTKYYNSLNAYKVESSIF